MSPSSTEIVEELIEAIANSDAEKLLSTLADDVSWTFFLAAIALRALSRAKTN
ncbi:MAG: hypothetical protein K2Y51_02600 [Gammaproteobacteria bacterium]|nr:hypothetical protein [Gammaproteobacteria bacterium]